MSPQVALTHEDLVAVRTGVVMRGRGDVMVQRLRCRVLIVALTTPVIPTKNTNQHMIRTRLDLIPRIQHGEGNVLSVLLRCRNNMQV